MSLFLGFFRSSHQEHETRPPLPPQLSQTATQIKIEKPADIPLSSVERDLEGESGGELKVSAYNGFESLYERFEQQLFELQLLRSAHHDAVNTIEVLQSAHQQDISIINTLRDQLSQISTESKQSLKYIKSQKNQLVSQRDQTIAGLRAELAQQQEASANKEKEHLTKEKEHRTKEKEHRTKEKKLLQDERQASSKALARAHQAVEEQRILSVQVAQRVEEVQGLPRGILRSSFAARPVQPFVVVLIDGDAYQFARDLTQDPLLGGARGAERLRSEVFKYMATCSDIPLHSKIVVRVFSNASSQRGKVGKGGLRRTPAVHTFMIQFSETHPLFDFLDCGSGKERADTKLKQNFELFIDNPYCRGMFLAICYDGGFVRMLEPYQHLKDTLDKIVLIKAGQVAPGFLSVPLFRFTEFPSVFQELYSLKIGPIGKTLSGAHEPNSADMDIGSTLCNDDEQEPEDLPIKDLTHVSWSHPRRYVRSTATLLGLAYEATLLSVVTRGAVPTPELVALHVVPFRLSGLKGGPEVSATADEKQRIKTKIRALESAIHQKKQAAKLEGISKTARKTLQWTAGSLEDELSRLKRLVAQKPRKY